MKVKTIRCLQRIYDRSSPKTPAILIAFNLLVMDLNESVFDQWLKIRLVMLRYNFSLKGLCNSQIAHLELIKG